VVSITRTAAQVLAIDRITSNCICPGAVDTPMWRKIDAEWTEIEGWEIREAWKRRTSLIPLGRPETPEDVAGVVSFLASRDSDYMTGQAVNIDGGLVMGSWARWQASDWERYQGRRDAIVFKLYATARLETISAITIVGK